MRTFAKGNLMLLQYGEYSDQGTIGIFRALKGLHMDVMIQEYKDKINQEHGFATQEAADESYTVYYDRDKFIAWLQQSGYIEPVDYDTCHFDGYSLKVT